MHLALVGGDLAIRPVEQDRVAELSDEDLSDELHDHEHLGRVVTVHATLDDRGHEARDRLSFTGLELCRELSAGQDRLDDPGDGRANFCERDRRGQLFCVTGHSGLRGALPAESPENDTLVLQET